MNAQTGSFWLFWERQYAWKFYLYGYLTFRCVCVCNQVWASVLPCYVGTPYGHIDKSPISLDYERTIFGFQKLRTVESTPEKFINGVTSVALGRIFPQHTHHFPQWGWNPFSLCSVFVRAVLFLKLSTNRYDNCWNNCARHPPKYSAHYHGGYSLFPDRKISLKK